jgi:hypothetical protein
MDKTVHVLKRDGTRELVTPERIKDRLKSLMDNLNTTYVNLDIVVAKVCKGIYDGVTTEVLDELSAETCAYMSIVHPDYSKLAARIAISNLHKKTDDCFLKTAELLYTYKDKAGMYFKNLNLFLSSKLLILIVWFII